MSFKGKGGRPPLEPPIRGGGGGSAPYGGLALGWDVMGVVVLVVVIL